MMNVHIEIKRDHWIMAPISTVINLIYKVGKYDLKLFIIATYFSKKE